MLEQRKVEKPLNEKGVNKGNTVTRRGINTKTTGSEYLAHDKKRKIRKGGSCKGGPKERVD